MTQVLGSLISRVSNASLFTSVQIIDVVFGSRQLNIKFLKYFKFGDIVLVNYRFIFIIDFPFFTRA